MSDVSLVEPKMIIVYVKGSEPHFIKVRMKSVHASRSAAWIDDYTLLAMAGPGDRMPDFAETNQGWICGVRQFSNLPKFYWKLNALRSPCILKFCYKMDAQPVLDNQNGPPTTRYI